MKDFKIEEVHIGEDYYGMKVNGKYIELSLNEGYQIISLIKIIKMTANNSSYHNQSIK